FFADAVAALCRKQWLGSGENAVEQLARPRHIAQRGGVNESDKVLVEYVAGPKIGLRPQDGLIVRPKRSGETGDQRVHLLVAGLIATACADAGESGDVLAE